MSLIIVHIISSTCSSLASILFNFILMVLIIKKTPQSSNAYSHILLQTCCTDIFLAFVIILTLLEVESVEATIYFRTMTPWYPKSGIYPCLAIWLYVIGVVTTILSLIIQVIFRYFVIIKKYTPSKTQTWIAQLAIFLFSAVVSIPYLIIPCSCGRTEDARDLMALELWSQVDFESFTSQSLLNPYFLGFVIILVISTTTLFISFGVLNLKVQRKLKTAASLFSSKTLQMHQQFSRKILIQAIPPCVAFTAVTIILMSVYIFTKSATGGHILIATMFLQYIIVFNPVITLLSIKAYRRALFCERIEHGGSSSNPKSAMPVSTIAPVL